MDASEQSAQISSLVARIAALESFIYNLTSEASSSNGTGDDVYAVSVGDDSVSTDVSAFALSTEGEKVKIINCCYQVGRRHHRINDYTISGSPGGKMYVLRVDHDNPSGATIVSANSPSCTDEKTEIPLYKFNFDGTIQVDYRGAPVIPLYE